MTSSDRLFIVDTDVGADDAVALILCLKNHKRLGITIEAISVCFGNIPVGNATTNVSRILDVMNESVPIYKGASEPLVGKFILSTWEGFGTDGLGDGLPLELYPGKRKAEPEHAAIAIIKAARKHAGKLELLCLGPLTNIALALKLDPSIAKLMKNVFVMGGTSYGKGNATASAEFNFHQDPEAAAVVFASDFPLTMVSWELTRTTSVPITTWWKEWISKNTPLASFLRLISIRWTQHELEKNIDEFCACDAVAAAVAFFPDIVLEQVHHHISIELGGMYSRGSTVIDWYDRRQEAYQTKATLITAVDTKKYLQLLEDLVK